MNNPFSGIREWGESIIDSEMEHAKRLDEITNSPESECGST
jgi:hypothetical protein